MTLIDHDKGRDAQQGAAAAAAAAAAEAAASLSSSSAALLVVADTKEQLAAELARSIVRCAATAVHERGAFSVALSGGSLPGLLTSLLAYADLSKEQNEEQDPRFDKWHVILADERMVPLDHPDSNLGELQKVALSKLPIPSSQIYGPRLPVDEDLEDAGAAASGEDDDDDFDDDAAIAAEYEVTIRQVLASTGGALDAAVLGFGPDGHTCSLFPGHPLLRLNDDDEFKARWVASIGDSPKPPPRRITLTLPLLNCRTRNVIFCGAGASKDPILRRVFASLSVADSEASTVGGAARRFTGILSDPPPYPCAMVRPGGRSGAATSDLASLPVTWIVDSDAARGIV